MGRGLTSFLNLLDFEGGNVLFQQREGEQQRTPFEMERQVLGYVAEGNADAMVAHYTTMLRDQPNFSISVGKLSKDELRHFKYMAVSAIAIVCRVAMYSGATEAAAYSLSDEMIQQIDSISHPETIVLLLVKAVYDYTKLVGESKGNANLSKPVRTGIEYIDANLHTKISLRDLAAKTDYAESYYAKLFKKETGLSFTDYVLQKRIEEAKRLLAEGKTSREITYVLQFCSQSYFIKQFKKVTGMTPKEYTEAGQENPF
jgi:YesN/AraC family two-component response regulator